MVDAAIQEALTLAASPAGNDDDSDQAQQHLLESCIRLLSYHLRSTIVIALILEIIHDRRLHKPLGFESFGDFVAKKYHYSHSRGYQYVDAAEVYRNLVHICGLLPMPTCEGHIRPLVGLEPEEQAEVWRRVVADTPIAEAKATDVKRHVLAFMREQALRQPEEATAATEIAPHGELGDNGDECPRNEGQGAVAAEQTNDDAGRSPDLAATGTDGPAVPYVSESGRTTQTSRGDVFPRSAVGYLIRVYGGAQPQAPPARDAIGQGHASDAWVHQTPRPQEQERRRAFMERYSLGYCAAMGRDIILTTFWAMVWMGIIRETSEGSGMYYLAEVPAAITAGGEAVA